MWIVHLALYRPYTSLLPPSSDLLDSTPVRAIAVQQK
jgi:hypothetical protein